MPQALTLDYYYGSEGGQYSFYRIPKVLFTEPRYRGLSADAKILYGLMLDRMGLSYKNGWLDKQNRVYIFFTLEETLELLGCGKDKAVKLFKELESIGLMERRKQGQGKPAIIYVKNFVSAGIQTVEKQKPGQQTSEKPDSALRHTRIADSGITAPNKTDRSETDWNETDPSIYPCGEASGAQPRTDADGMEERKLYRQILYDNLSYPALITDRPEDKERLDGLVEMMLDVVCSGRRYIRLGREDKPAALVKSRFLKLTGEHIRYVLDCMDETTTKIRNVRTYLLTGLYNAPDTIDQFYASRVSHDLYGGDG